MTESPRIALESTVIAHGLPFPANLETARGLEAVARSRGVEPRTIAVLGGQIKIGLSDAELTHLAKAKDVLKLSRRDIAVAIVQKRDGATTVSATMYLAHRAGIRVFATGGIGGVHRAGLNAAAGETGPAGTRSPVPFLATDVSADLTELASTPVAVVCAGAKAILDLPATLEFLETHNVPVIGYQSNEFPAFYSRRSGLQAQVRVDSARQAGELIRAHWELGNPGGLLFCVPIPEKDEIPREEIEPYIERALSEAQEKGVAGSETTPFLLRRLAEMTEGRSVRANVALLKNNVAAAAEIARELAVMEDLKA